MNYKVELHKAPCGEAQKKHEAAVVGARRWGVGGRGQKAYGDAFLEISKVANQ